MRRAMSYDTGMNNNALPTTCPGIADRMKYHFEHVECEDCWALRLAVWTRGQTEIAYAEGRVSQDYFEAYLAVRDGTDRAILSDSVARMASKIRLFLAS